MGDLVSHKEYMERLRSIKEDMLLVPDLYEGMDLILHVFLIPKLGEVYVCANPKIVRKVEVSNEVSNRVIVNRGFDRPPYGMCFPRKEEEINELGNFLRDYVKNGRTEGLVDRLSEIGISRETIEELAEINQKELEKNLRASSWERRS